MFGKLFWRQRCIKWLWVALLGGVLTGCGQYREAEIEKFMARHWADPVLPQGAPPAQWSELEASLSPEACGQCHVEQWNQWKTALHSHTMGSGIRWQFDVMNQSESNKCMRCHAPLAEQKALIALSQGWSEVPADPPPKYVAGDLADRGLVCAACHVRNHQHFGPGRRESKPEQPHGSFVAAAAFGDSRFCGRCHQFPDDGPRLAGKLREDTLGQWQASSFAGKQSCQECHMPNAQHLWRGIHDPEMLRKGLSVHLRLVPLESGRYRAEISASNVGAGHHLPTYMVPKIDLELNLLPDQGAAQSLALDVIGWKADVAIESEEFDTRLAAGETRRFAHDFTAPAMPGWQAELVVKVAPREHYERMFRHYLGTLTLGQQTRLKLKQAIKEAEDTRYVAYRIHAKP